MPNETAVQEHTPGPWVVVNGGTIRADGGKRPVAMCHCSAVWNTSDSTPTRFECEANARLIAAAPELLEACRSALDAARYVVSICEADVIAGESAVPTQKSCPNEVLANAYAAMSFSMGVSAAIAKATKP